MEQGRTSSTLGMCCDGKADREGWNLRLRKWVRRSEFDYRVIKQGDLYTIRRSKRGSGIYRNSWYWECCQCGRWLERFAVPEAQAQAMEKDLRTFASGATADRVAWRLNMGFPTHLELLATIVAGIVVVATVISAVVALVSVV